jgi:thiol-disulfide isomerase/thioredoxin
MSKISSLSRSLKFACLAGLLLLPGCDDPDDGSSDGPVGDGDTSGDGDTEADTDSQEGETEGGTEEPDTDQDGLTDAEEADLGTDPTKKDTDADNYWDSWELLEGTDPLDVGSRIYTGFWPYNPDKDALVQGTWDAASTTVGSQFPRQTFLDQHGDSVELYDFANFTINDTGEPAYFIIDMSAQWCGPCHNMAEWMSGADTPDTAGLQQIYPSVREKVHKLRIWWITIIVENQAGGPPGLNDSQSWFGIHQDPYIPILVDETQQVRNTYGGGSYPFFFLLDPLIAVEFWQIAGPGDNTFPALWMVQEYL